MGTQEIRLVQFWVIEVISWVVGHPDPFHHGPCDIWIRSRDSHPGSSANAADSLEEMSGSEPGGCGVFAEVVAEIGQREVDVTVACGLDQL